MFLSYPFRNVHSRSAGRPTINLLKEQGLNIYIFAFVLICKDQIKWWICLYFIHLPQLILLDSIPPKCIMLFILQSRFARLQSILITECHLTWEHHYAKSLHGGIQVLKREITKHLHCWCLVLIKVGTAQIGTECALHCVLSLTKHGVRLS